MFSQNRVAEYCLTRVGNWILLSQTIVAGYCLAKLEWVAGYYLTKLEGMAGYCLTKLEWVAGYCLTKVSVVDANQTKVDVVDAAFATLREYGGRVMLSNQTKVHIWW